MIKNIALYKNQRIFSKFEILMHFCKVIDLQMQYKIQQDIILSTIMKVFQIKFYIYTLLLYLYLMDASKSSKYAYLQFIWWLEINYYF